MKTISDLHREEAKHTLNEFKLTLFEHLTVQSAIDDGSLWNDVGVDIDGADSGTDFFLSRRIAMLVVKARGWRFQWHRDMGYGDGVVLVDRNGKQVNAIQTNRFLSGPDDDAQTEIELAWQTVRR